MYQYYSDPNRTNKNRNRQSKIKIKTGTWCYYTWEWFKYLVTSFQSIYLIWKQSKTIKTTQIYGVNKETSQGMIESSNKNRTYLILQKYKYRIIVRIWNKMKFKGILLKFI